VTGSVTLSEVGLGLYDANDQILIAEPSDQKVAK
jgi:hypothetical protein